MSNEELMQKLDRIELQLARIQLQQRELLANRRAEEPVPTLWLRPKAAALAWNLSDSTLRKYRTREWKDGSFNWLEGIHWKPRGGYNRAVIEHWFTYRYDHVTHRDYIDRWLKASNRLPASLQKRYKGKKR